MNYATSILGFLPGGRRATGISQLLEKLEAFLPPAQVERVAPQDLAVRRIGHFGAFRGEQETRLWPRMAQWLQGLGQGAANAGVALHATPAREGSANERPA